MLNKLKSSVEIWSKIIIIKKNLHCNWSWIKGRCASLDTLLNPTVFDVSLWTTTWRVWPVAERWISRLCIPLPFNPTNLKPGAHLLLLKDGLKVQSGHLALLPPNKFQVKSRLNSSRSQSYKVKWRTMVSTEASLGSYRLFECFLEGCEDAQLVEKIKKNKTWSSTACKSTQNKVTQWFAQQKTPKHKTNRGYNVHEISAASSFPAEPLQSFHHSVSPSLLGRGKVRGHRQNM